MTGAAVLSAAGALRSGAGLVTVGVPATELSAVARRIRPEAMTLGLPATSRGALAASACQKVVDFIHRRGITVLAAGPGLSVNLQTRSLLERLLTAVSLPIILDADALNNLAGVFGGLAKRFTGPVTVTPHPGEMSRLTGLSVARIQKDRVVAATALSRRLGVICVLKGAGTVVTDGRRAYLNTTGNPGMATGGSGDVLTGSVAALIAQKGRAGCLEAAAAAVYLHGLAGDIAARAKNQRGLLAMDIAEALPRAMRRVHD